MQETGMSRVRVRVTVTVTVTVRGLAGDGDVQGVDVVARDVLVGAWVGRLEGGTLRAQGPNEKKEGS